MAAAGRVDKPQKLSAPITSEPAAERSTEQGSGCGPATPRLALKSIEAAARKKEHDLRKLIASAKRREAAAERRTKIAAAFKAEQANSRLAPQRISNKPRAAWEEGGIAAESLR